MSEGATILLADDDRAIRLVVTRALEEAGFRVRATDGASTLWQWIEAGTGDAVITDVVMPDGDGLDLLPRIRNIRPNLPVIVMSARNTLKTAVAATERGAYEYLSKPFDINELIHKVKNSLDNRLRSNHKNKSARAKQEDLPLVGRSPAMQDVYRIMARLMPTDLTVLITGESGTGKELVARALHTMGKRKHGSFVAINMAAIPRELIESELFGHEKGAFTGAIERGIGRFEQAQGGTLFLDEIGDMPFEAQTRLLRVLQQGEFTTIGGRTALPADVRIIAATNKDLADLVAVKSFREDLYYRLNVVPVELPPLRSRVSDLPDLIAHFSEKCAAAGLPHKQYDPSALERMKSHGWPGNVRELENLVRRLSALYADETISGKIIQAELQPKTRSRDKMPVGASLDSAVEQHLAQYFANHADGLPPPGLYPRILKEVERPLLTMTLAATRGNQIRAAELLGLNRNTLRKKIRALGIKISRQVE